MAHILDGSVGVEYGGGLDIDGVPYGVTVVIGPEHSGEGYPPSHDITITIPAVEPWAVANILRAISEDFASEPRCDLCGAPEGDGEADWNGETGNHLSCEAERAEVDEHPTQCAGLSGECPNPTGANGLCRVHS